MELTLSDNALIKEEEDILSRVRQAVNSTVIKKAFNQKEILQRFIDVRDDYSDAQSDELPALVDQLHSLKSLAAMSQTTSLPDSKSPYFAHLKIRSNGKISDVLLGYQ